MSLPRAGGRNLRLTRSEHYPHIYLIRDWCVCEIFPIQEQEEYIQEVMWEVDYLFNPDYPQSQAYRPYEALEVLKRYEPEA